MKKENKSKSNKSMEGMNTNEQKKLKQQKELASQKRQEMIMKVATIGLVVLVVGLICWTIASGIIDKFNEVDMNENYSEQIADNGRIKDVVATDVVKLLDYTSIVAKLSDLEYSDEDLEKAIADIVKANAYTDSSSEIVAKLNDTVDIDFTGTVDGKEFEGGKSEGYSLILGSKSFIDDFEEQIVGHSPGDEFDVEVTFPDDYSNDPTLAGKDAVFAVKLNGVKVSPEFNDEFVEKNLSEYATTAEGYRKYLKDSKYESNLKTFVRNYVIENTEIVSLPKAFVNQLKGNYKADEYNNYIYTNFYYSSNYGYQQYASFENYLSTTYSMTEKEYDASLDEKVNEQLKYALGCQAIAEKEGITVTVEDAKKAYVSDGNTAEDFDKMVEKYGTGYMVKQCMNNKVIELLSKNVKAE